MENNKFGYMCGASFQHDLNEYNGRHCRIYGNLEALKANESCWKECGIVMVELREVGWVEEQDLFNDEEA